jgi:hypothetical protein
MIPQLLCPHQFPFFEKNFARKPAQHFHFAGLNFVFVSLRLPFELAAPGVAYPTCSHH